jgi:hypothetical protein
MDRWMDRRMDRWTHEWTDGEAAGATDRKAARRAAGKVARAGVSLTTVVLSTEKNQRDSRDQAAASAKEDTNNGLLPKKRIRDSLSAADSRPATWSQTDHPDDSTSNA